MCLEGNNQARTIEGIRRTIATRSIAIVAGVLFVLLATVPARAAVEGPTYPVTKMGFRYLVDHPKLPAIEELNTVEVTLGVSGDVYVAGYQGERTETLRLGDFNGERRRELSAGAVQQVLVAIRDHMTAGGLMGVYVVPDPTQISENGQDLRIPDEQELRIVVAIALATEVRTLAFEERIDPEARVNHPLHQRIRDHSPVQPFDRDAADEDRDDLVNREAIEDYTTFLSRHPGRRVDVAVGPSTTPGGVSLDYLVTEHKPWLVYYKIANTGTEATSEWRHQFGYRDYQFTDIDDILAIDYATAGFEESHNLVASYERPLSEDYRLRGRVFGGYSEYTATDIGVFSDTFTGQSHHLGAELDWNFKQVGEYFFDIGGGLRYENIQNTDTLIGSMDADNDFLILYIAAQIEGLSDWHPMNAEARIEWQSEAINDLSVADLIDHGRAPVTDDWARLAWTARQSVFLEPLLNREGWEDPGTPESSTLAHEVYLLFHGQHTFGERVIPSYQQVAGGFYTVRGYPESVAVGDTVFAGSMEYRYHLPRALPIDPDPPTFRGEPFRVAPQQVYGPTDWDMILKGFVDAAHTINHGSGPAPRDTETLLGAGIGLELQYKRNVTIRTDWGWALHEVPGVVDEGSGQFHFELTVLY